MGNESVVLKTVQGRKHGDVPATRVTFCAHQCLAFDGGKEDHKVVQAISEYLATLDDLAFFGDGKLLDYLIELAPFLLEKISCLIVDFTDSKSNNYDLKTVHPDNIPGNIKNVFLCETLTYQRMLMRKRLPDTLAVIELDNLWTIAPDVVPKRAWTSLEHNIYPIEIPEIEFKSGMDMLLIDCPSRNLSMMPNGLGYVHNALKKADINFQTLDLDIIVYHRYHIHRLYDMGGKIILPSGKEAPTDPWQAENYDFWTLGSEHESNREEAGEVLEFFRPIIDEIIDAIVKAKPKMLGLSIQQCNEAFSRQVVKGVKAALPEVLILVGGYSCYNPDIGRRAFMESDYMFIGEAELTIGPVVNALAKGERPFNQPGVLSRFDTEDYKYIPGPMPHNIDQIEFPKYEWFDDLTIYQNYNGYQLTPIIASRGCRWSRCTFCAERFYWRIRSAANFVDELQWLIDQGAYLFMFNESDLNGMPEKVLEICDEIIKRGLHKKAKLTGQLRIHKKCNRAFFDKLRAANFVALRFGVDAFSENTLRLQKKGYTVEMAENNLRDCWEAGIFTEVNWVIGVPGETDKDIEEGIEMILRNQKYIGRLANINPLIMVNGGVYWIDPEAHNIVFKEPKDKLYEEFPRAMPANVWYSTNPFIDAQVRKERFEKIVVSLYEAGFPVGIWANRVIEDVKFSRDKMRASSGDKQTEYSSEENAQARLVQMKKEESNASSIPEEVVSKPEGDQETKDIMESDTKGSFKGDQSLARIDVNDKSDVCETGENSQAEPEITVEPPEVINTTDTHRIVSYLGWCYAIPLALGEIDLSTCDMSEVEGIVRAVSEKELMDLLAQSASWADSRGSYSAQKRQRKQGADYRAGSFIGAVASEPLEFDPVIINHENQFYAVRKELWEQMNGEYPSDKQLNKSNFIERIKKRFSSSTHKEDSSSLSIVGVISEGAEPELMWSIENYNIVKFDNYFYALPFGLPIDWNSGTVARLPGVITHKSLKGVMELLEAKLGIKISDYVENPQDDTLKGSGPADNISKVPELLGSIEDYNLVSYEGWVYGIPQSLGSVDLTEIDIMEVPGVFRDVSRDVVEHEIQEKIHMDAIAN